MSRDILEQVVARAVGDAAYRQLLRTNPTAALRGLRLTAQERAALTGGDPAKLVALGIDQRMSRALVVPGRDDYMYAHREADTDASAAERQLDPNRTDFAATNRIAGEPGTGANYPPHPGATEARIGEPPGGEFDASLIVTPAETAGQAHLRMVEEMLDVSGTVAGDSLPADAMGTVESIEGLHRLREGATTEAAGIEGLHRLREGATTEAAGIEGTYRLREGTEPAVGDATPAGATPFRTDILPDHEAAPSAVESDQWPGDSLAAGAMDTESAGIGGTWRLREGVEPAAGDSTPAGALASEDTDAQQESMTNVEWSKPEAVEEPPSDADLTEY